MTTRPAIAFSILVVLGGSAVAETAGNWRINRFAPEFTATTKRVSVNSDPKAPTKLSVACRAGVAVEVKVIAAGSWGAGPQYWREQVQFRINDNPPVANAVWLLAADGTGVTLYSADAGAQAISALPANGTVAFRIAPSEGEVHEAVFSLEGLAAVRRELAKACGGTG